jgi:hypothetical protein
MDMRYMAITCSIALLGSMACMGEEDLAGIDDDIDEMADEQALEEGGSPDLSDHAQRDDTSGDPELAGPGVLAGPYWWRNVATLRCLDSNTSGQVYTLGCNGGSFQLWTWTGARTAVEHRNLATGFCLTSSPSGLILAHPCHGQNSQKWRRDGRRWINVQSGKCLDSNTLGEVYSHVCNGGNFQNWE